MTSRADTDIDAELESHRRELTAYCYRMLGSNFEAEDAVQETLVRAWRGIDGFEGRAALRSWLYRIATNVCIDMQRGPQRRARPMDLGPASPADTMLPPGLPESNWVQPMPDALVMPEGGDPAETAAARDAIRLAFIAALQLLPPRQRAVLILRDVLRWHASEVASLLDTSVASVNSALQRAHATIDAADLDAPSAPPQDARQRDLLARYVAAFESYDVAALVDLLHEDATFCMPPFAMWLTGADQVAKWLVGQGAGCRGSRLVATAANGCAAFGSYKPAGAGRHDAWSIQVLEIHDGRITTWHNFLDTSLFPVFDLPLSLTG